MIRVISENLATIIISAVLICLAVLAVLKIWKDKKRGSCGCGCSECPQSEICHKE